MTSSSSWQEELGVAIRKARRAARLSQTEIAVAVGVRQSSVSQWERGLTAPKTHHLLRPLKLLGSALVGLFLACRSRTTRRRSRRWKVAASG
jgi:transcriptional regulator with XRE-family HTH domain